jgi:predicted nucleic-acid-binding Zn-ribbon protein
MNHFAPCPKCRQTNARQLNFTWWGGALGPKLFTHVKCESCGTKFNGKTGRDNTVKIILYSVIMGVFFFVIFAVMFAFLFSR